MNDEMVQNCLNYKNVVIKRWGLQRRLRRKSFSIKNNVYHILHAHWSRCMKMYVNEKQRLYVAAGIFLFFISSASDKKAEDEQLKKVSPTASKGSKNRISRHRRHSPRTTGAAPDRYSTAGSEIGQHDNRPTASEKRKRALSDNNTEYRVTKKT
ncbi:hypothetical protein AJ78_08714 [Emergomyces pasteurianus Ep9510]|uniref:Uncharacterized protein n=1 Tax=Emergomyces pasteurianus Ep9510 TaxID=1447872 RepID=A0A1J9P019_9EURO|nr:hypothetical protein AJ78_08714 [Emergomyces pasteurianus Ep9510]